MSSFTKIIVLVLFIVGSLTIHHPLRHLESQFKKLAQVYNSKDTSKAFSIAMKIFTSVQIFKKQAEISSPNNLKNQNSVDCQSLLKSIVEFSSSKNWAEMYQTIHQKIKLLQSSCTNRNFQFAPSQVKGGFQNKCALCVIVLRVMQNYWALNTRSITDFVQRQFCDLFDGIVRPTCQAFVHYAGPKIIHGIINKQTPDVTCLKIGYCQNPQCKILKAKQQRLLIQIQPDNKPAPWQWLVHIFKDKFGDGHLPPFDLDNDTFGDVSTFRGYHWRGADCNQFSQLSYPGRKKGSLLFDQDCNGIYGMNSKGKTYESQFCSKSKRFGVAVIGDSAGAHFSIPEKYFNASMINKTTYHDLLYRAADQLDIPHQSGYTGNTKTNGYIRHSFYKYARQWNLCNHNDYQNIAVNGGDSGNTWDNIPALTRDNDSDYPLIMFMQLVGNDVCSKSFDGMTTVQHFKANILKLLNYLDSKVPAGSHLMILGLADGQLLYDNLHDWTHPLNVTYADVYDFLNCLKISPCWGWLNTNATVRRFTTDRAKNLSKVYQQIIDQGYKFQNFDIVYYDFPAMQILQRKIIQGGDAKQMIQRCDGFHPNGQFHSDLADWLWNKVQTHHSDWIGKKNPFNQEIRRIFGHQIIN